MQGVKRKSKRRSKSVKGGSNEAEVHTNYWIDRERY